MVKLPHSQKKLIIIVCSGILVFIVFWNFIFLPAKRQIAKISPEVAVSESQKKAVEWVLARNKTVPAAKKYLKDRFQELNIRIFQKEDKTLASLSSFAKRLNIEVISITQGEKKDFLDAYGQKVELFGKNFYVIPVSIEIKCYYKDLVRYLDLLNDSFLNFNTVESLNIKRAIPKSKRLSISLNMNIYSFL